MSVAEDVAGSRDDLLHQSTSSVSTILIMCSDFQLWKTDIKTYYGLDLPLEASVLGRGLKNHDTRSSNLTLREEVK